MTTPPACDSARWRRRLSTFLLYRARACALALLLAPPLLWLGVVYLGSLPALLVQSFFTLDDFTGQVVRRAHPGDLPASSSPRPTWTSSCAPPAWPPR